MALVAAFPPKAVYLRYMGQFTPDQLSPKGKAMVTHLPGLGGPVLGDIETWVIKEQIISMICAMTDPHSLAVLRDALSRSQARTQ